MPHTPLLENAPRIVIHARGLMTDDEAMFWERLRQALRARNHELLLIAYHRAKVSMDVPLLLTPSGYGRVPYISRDKGWWSWILPNPPYDQDGLLARDAVWHGEPARASTQNQRIFALKFFWHFYSDAIQMAQPSLVVIWNGQHSQEMLLDQIARSAGSAVHYLERGPFQGTIQLDEEAILGGTRVARAAEWEWPDGTDLDVWQDSMKAVEKSYRENQNTWWEQPESVGTDQLRRRLGINDGAKVILFAGQVDADTQNMLYSPHFEDSLDAFTWFCSQIHDEDVFILGKHHPKSSASPEEFRAVVGDRGVWLTDVSLQDCMALADRVAAVNSTVLYEGLMMEKPVLMMGQSLLSNKQIAFEIDTLAGGGKVIGEWIAAFDFNIRRKRWLDFGAYLLACQLFSMNPENSAQKQRGADALADYLVAHAAQNSLPDQEARGFVDLYGLWFEASQAVAATRRTPKSGMNEVMRGLNIAAKASVGALSPRLYDAILRAANLAYGKMTGRKL